MAITTCTECKMEMSDQATACPKCGAPPKAAKPGSAGRVIKMLLVLLILGAGGSLAVVWVQARRSGMITTDDVGDLTDTLAAEVGVKTERQAAADAAAAQLKRETDARNQAISERNRHIQGLNAAVAEWTTLVDRPTTGPDEPEALRRKIVDLARAAKGALEAQKKVADAATLAEVAQQLGVIGTIEARFAAARVMQATCNANRDWGSTGVNIQAGDAIHIWASGQWKAGPDWKPCGPDGTDETSRLADYRMFKGANKLMALCARVTGQAEEGSGFVSGSHSSFAAPASGTLQLRCNDTGVNNNEGQMTVTIIAIAQ